MPRPKIKNLLILLPVLIGLIFANYAFAASNYDPEEIKAKLDELNKEIERDVQSLKKQINYIDAQIEKTELQIEVTEQEIDLINIDILRTEEEIEETLEGMETDKEKLAESIRDYYEYDRKDILIVTLMQTTVSGAFDEVVYIENIQEQINDSIKELKGSKGLIEEDKLILEKSKEELNLKIESYNRQIVEMKELREKKADLVELTGGDEAKYKELLANIETQKKQLLGDLASLARQRKAELARLIRRYGSVPRGLFGVPSFYQTAYPGIRLGPSPYFFSNYGCAVTSVAMVLKYYKKNSSLTPMTLNNDWKNIFACSGGSGAFCWSGVTNAPYKMKLSGRVSHAYGKNINLDNYFKPGRPMIVFLNTRKNSPPVGHYVVVTGKLNNDYVVNDPILGSVKLKVSKAAVELWYREKVYVDQVIIYTP
jgi:peptidoglycan hydrolase CwlO-like protein